MSDAFQAKLSLFPVREKKNEKGPDQTGTIEISQDQVAALRSYLMSAETEDDWQGNPVVKLSVSTWTSEMKDGRKYMKGQVKPPYKPPVDSAPAPVNSAEVPF